MKKYLIIAVAIVIVGSLLYRAGHNVDTKPIKMGGLFDLTGVTADIGESLKRGSEIAIEKINANAGINGRMIEIVYEDATDGAAKPAINGAQKLMNIDKVDIILDYPYSGLSSIAKTAEQLKIPVLDVIDSSDQIASFGDWVFGVGMYDDGVGKFVAEFAKNELGAKNVAMLVGKDEYLYAVAGGFEEGFQSLGGNITRREEFLIGENDFRTQLLKLFAKEKPEAIFVSHFGEGGKIIKQASELGFSGAFLGSDTFSLADVPRVAGKLLDHRTYFGLWRNFDSQTKEQLEFVELYKQKYGEEPGDYLFYNVLGYDGVMVAAEALKKTGGDGGEKLKNALYQTQNHQGLSGPISIDQSGINRDTKTMMVMYKDGKIVRYK